MDDVLEVPTLWNKLRPRDSPFTAHNYYGGGFVDEDDRVALSSIYFASQNSTGARDGCKPKSKQQSEILADTTFDDDVRLNSDICTDVVGCCWSAGEGLLSTSAST